MMEGWDLKRSTTNENSHANFSTNSHAVNRLILCAAKKTFRTEFPLEENIAQGIPIGSFPWSESLSGLPALLHEPMGHAGTLGNGLSQWQEGPGRATLVVLRIFHLSSIDECFESSGGSHWQQLLLLVAVVVHLNPCAC